MRYKSVGDFTHISKLHYELVDPQALVTIGNGGSPCAPRDGQVNQDKLSPFRDRGKD